MRSSTAFLKLSQGVSNISRVLQGKQKYSKKSSFVIVNTDARNGYYIKALLKALKQYPFLQKQFGTPLQQIQTMDVIVFGSSNEFDYCIERDITLLDRLDGRKFKAYDLINDFKYILSALERYITKNYINVQNDGYGCFDTHGFGFPTINYPSSRVQTTRIIEQPIIQKHCFVGDVYDAAEEERDIVLNINFNQQGQQQRLVKKQHSDRPVQYTNCYDKVTVHNKWVKIGYNQYDIYRDSFCNEYICLNGEVVPVKEDRYGEKYLKF